MKKRLLALLLAVLIVSSSATVAVLADDPEYFIMEDFGFVPADDTFGNGHFNVGWRYTDGFDTDEITSIEVGLKDNEGQLIIKYTAKGEQLNYQKENGHITSAKQSSAPFYTMAYDKAIAEIDDSDWTVTFGDAFDKWNVYDCYVTVTTADGSQTLANVSSHTHNYSEEIISEAALASVATGDSPAKYYKTCSDCGAISGSDRDTFSAEPAKIFTMQDFNLWGSNWEGAFNVGWKYADGFDIDSITGLEVGLKDKNGKAIITYTASGDQIEWQKTHGHITSGGQSSAPFYKEYNGSPIEEGAGEDWTVEFGEAFDKWDIYSCYVTVIAAGAEYTQTNTCTHQHNYDEEVVSDIALKSPATAESPAVYYKTCSACGAISSDDDDTFTSGVTLKEMFTMEDVGIWGEDWFGAYNVGWKYADSFDTDSITAIEVGLVDGKNNVIVKYTATGEQLEYQKNNGNISDTNRSSAPFYKEYNGEPIKEGEDLDWTVEFGPAFGKWDVHFGYVTVTAGNFSLSIVEKSSHEHSYTGEVVSEAALKSPATTSSPAVYFKTCTECGAIASDSEHTFKYGEPLPPEPNVPDTYPITVADTANGSVDVSYSNASKGSVITVTVAPDEGFIVGSVSVTGEDGAVEVTRVNSTTYSFVMPESAVTVSVNFVSGSAGFVDVPAGAWYSDAVAYVYANGLMQGTSATTFEPDAGLTRSMVWAVLARMDGETVSGTGWQSVARAWAVRSGVSDGTDPNGLITREQLVTMLWRFAGEPTTDATLSGYSDAASVNAWATTAMAWAIDNGIITGVTNTTIVPAGTATRAQCAAILMRYVENV